MRATPKAVYLRPFLVMRLAAELLTVPKRVTVCWFYMVSLPLSGQSGHIPKRADESVTELSFRQA